MSRLPPLPERNHPYPHILTDDELREWGESCARMAREEAAKIAEETIVAEFEGVDYYGDKAAAAIRKGNVAPDVKPGDCIHCGKEICNDLGWCNDFKANRG